MKERGGYGAEKWGEVSMEAWRIIIIIIISFLCSDI